MLTASSDRKRPSRRVRRPLHNLWPRHIRPDCPSRSPLGRTTVGSATARGDCAITSRRCRRGIGRCASWISRPWVSSATGWLPPRTWEDLCGSWTSPRETRLHRSRICKRPSWPPGPSRRFARRRSHGRSPHPCRGLSNKPPTIILRPSDCIPMTPSARRSTSSASACVRRSVT